MKNYIRFVVVVLFALIAVNVSAQSAGDRLFAQGQKYQMKQTVKSNNLAISKIRSAKAAYDSATKKAMCDNQIAICQNNIKTINSKSKVIRHKDKHKTTDNTQEKQPQEAEPEREPVKLSLSVSSFEFKAAG